MAEHLTSEDIRRKIFISYRRADSADVSERIHDRLIDKFGRENVFIDVDDMQSGRDFRTQLEEALSQCSVLLVVIGDRWLTAQDEYGNRRLDDPNDYVRMEIETAFSRGITIIPLTLDGVSMPEAKALPLSIRNLAYIHNIPVRHNPDFHSDMDKLIDRVAGHINLQQQFHQENKCWKDRIRQEQKQHHIKRRSGDRARRTERQLGTETTLAFYGSEDIENATRYYIPPHCSSVDPTQEDEIRDDMGNGQSLFKVVDEFLVQNSFYRHLLLLADSGMGKSSFVLNYYARNRCLPKHRRHQLVVVPLIDPEADGYIAKIRNPQDVVLFLDAFDEDSKIGGDYKIRLDELMKACRLFKRLLITCRTQFFSTDELIPYKTSVPRVGVVRLGEKKEYEFLRWYLVPFDNQQAKRFLRKRYPTSKQAQWRKAQEIIRRTPQLGRVPRSCG